MRLTDEILLMMDADGGGLYLLEEYVGTTRCLVLSKTKHIPDRIDDLVRRWGSFGKIAADLNGKDE